MTSFVEDLEENDIFEEYAYYGCVAHPNGLIYGIPCHASRVVEYNTLTNTTRLVGDDLGYGSGKWRGGTVGSDNCIYCCPWNADRILKYDPTTETTTLVGDPVGGKHKYQSAVSVPQTNTIFFIPSRAKQVLVYSITDETTTFIGDTFNGPSKWHGACLSTVDGCIYCAPYCHRQVLKMNPVNGTTTLIGEEYDGSGKWCGCLEALDGSIYCSPMSASNFLKIDVRTGTTSLVGEIQQPEHRGGWKGYGWDGCVSTTINKNMYIFMVPNHADRILMFDTKNESVHEVGSGIRGCYIQPAISSIDGNAYAFPSGYSTSILKINLSQLQTLHQTIQVKGIPWPMLQSIAENNIHALEQGDSNTGLLPFMIAVESGDRDDDHDEKDPLDSLTLSYQLLSMKPAVINHYV